MRRLWYRFGVWMGWIQPPTFSELVTKTLHTAEINCALVERINEQHTASLSVYSGYDPITVKPDESPFWESEYFKGGDK